MPSYLRSAHAQGSMTSRASNASSSHAFAVARSPRPNRPAPNCWLPDGAGGNLSRAAPKFHAQRPSRPGAYV